MSNYRIIKNCDIIIVGQQPWDVEIGSNNKNIALEFSKHNRVLYVNPPLDRVTAFKSRKEPAVKKRLDIIKNKTGELVSINKTLWNYYPDTILASINWVTNEYVHNFLNKINNKRFARSIKKAAKQLGFKNYILFNDSDIFRSFYLKELLNPRISIYYSRDYLLTVDYWKRHGTRLEPELMAKSDICVANSVYLANNCREHNPNSFYVGQGCDVQDFTGYKGGIPDDIANIKGPIIGYVGVLQTLRLDIELLKHIALNRREYSIVLVGPEDDEFKASDLHKMENVHFLGSRPTDQMPAYISGFDVCLNPQIVNQVTIGNYPRKIDEYLAMGKPVVATLTEGMSVFKDHTYLGSSKDDYLNLINCALEENSPELQKERTEFASGHTWANSVGDIYKAIQITEEKRKNLKDKTILIFSNMRFDSSIEATSLFLARNLATHNKVYYIEYPLTYADYFRKKDTECYQKRKNSFVNADEAVISTDIPNLKKIALPFVIPANFLFEGKIFRTVLKMNERIILNRIKTVLKNEGIKDFVFINSFNFYYPGIGRALKPLLKIYQCIDPMVIPYDMKHGILSEKLLVENSDMVICTSKSLYEQKVKLNPNTYFVPNAADVAHSSKALDDKLPVHPKLRNIQKPVIGYFGTIERRIDYALMHEVINANPDKSFVFAGPLYTEHTPEWFLKTPNVYLLGPVPYSEMPQMLKGFDIAIIPFKKDKVSDTIFPLKLFEYLGAGKPVIVTDFNDDLKEFTRDAVKYCSDAVSFTNAMNDILANDNLANRKQRLFVAQQNTWEIRAKEIDELIDAELKDK